MLSYVGKCVSIDGTPFAMLRYTVICALKVYLIVSAQKSKYKGSTLSRVWPRPQMQVNHRDLYTYDPQLFEIEIIHKTCALLTEAVNRCTHNLKRLLKLVKNLTSKTRSMSVNKPIVKLQVELTNECEEYPQLGMEESYSLTVLSISNLKSTSIWGIIRGLETFTQLFSLTADHREIYVNKTDIHDYPRYSHRGLLIDTSRYFIPLASIFKTIKAMAINKMNVLHWHMTDDLSFPYQSEVLSELSSKDAFNSSMVYTNSNILEVISYARERGVRVIPEFDVSSHTRLWGIAYPKIMAECHFDNKTNVTLGTMNPINETTYKLIRRLFNEVQNVFKDKYFYLGGNEIDFPCWESNPTINKYMKDNNLKSNELLAMFFMNVFALLQNDTSPIVWQDVFDNGVPLNLDTIVHVWKGDGKDILQPILRGYQVLCSSNWYLNKSGTFDDFYKTDLQKMVTHITNKARITKLIIGGEACIWGEEVNNGNLITQVWPRTCAVAERLWSDVEDHNFSVIPAEVKYRLNQHVCHMIIRGIPIKPLEGNKTCVV